MPLPFIIAAAAVVAGGYGVKKGLDAKSDFDRAEDINNKSKRIFDSAKDTLVEQRESAQKAMNHLGEVKFETYEYALIPFVEVFSKIRNIDFDSKGIESAGRLPANTQDKLQDMRRVALDMKEVVGGGIAALGSGGLAGLAAYGGVGLLGTASTGTAIGALSGAAATNATLAWLGGGSLAAGGFGMAGGMAVLSGVVAGPVLAIGGMMMASKAEEAKHDAHANWDKAKLAAEQMKTAGVAVKALHARFEELSNVIKELNYHFQPLLASLTSLVAHDKNYRNYSIYDKKGVHMALNTALTLKNLLDTPVIDQEGQPTEDSEKVIVEGRKYLVENV